MPAKRGKSSGTVDPACGNAHVREGRGQTGALRWWRTHDGDWAEKSGMPEEPASLPPRPSPCSRRADFLLRGTRIKISESRVTSSGHHFSISYVFFFCFKDWARIIAQGLRRKTQSWLLDEHVKEMIQTIIA